jgi:hypothetical protein
MPTIYAREFDEWFLRFDREDYCLWCYRSWINFSMIVHPWGKKLDAVIKNQV